ncbi:hypothetical protein [Roseateles asaccharophilus]|uniref:Membrane protein n=1 Tax=Roseateles asaccharophilus TaxID=582607 RepID=A0ABU2A4N6_9BURK|nr:hypothetical protein [Roseateles asaccharophilus]MDR7332162.1 putative membrane protein [Roseateles asaccharophilus]
MFGLSALGLVHTLLGLVALVAGARCFLRDGAISTRSRAGLVFIGATVLTCVSGLGIFQRGGFNIAHALSIVALVTLVISALVERGQVLGRLSPYVATVGFSLSYFFHWIPGTTETFTRIPLGAPLFSSPEDPNLEKTVGVLFLVFLVGAAVQVWRLRQRQGCPAPAGRLA